MRGVLTHAGRLGCSRMCVSGVFTHAGRLGCPCAHVGGVRAHTQAGWGACAYVWIEFAVRGSKRLGRLRCFCTRQATRAGQHKDCMAMQGTRVQSDFFHEGMGDACACRSNGTRRRAHTHTHLDIAGRAAEGGSSGSMGGSLLWHRASLLPKVGLDPPSSKHTATATPTYSACPVPVRN